MGRLFKQRITRYRLADGKAVAKGTLGARKCKEKSKNWYGEYRDTQGVLKRVALCRDKAAAAAILHDKEVRAQRVAGLIDQFDEHSRTPLGDHLSAYKDGLVAAGDTPNHVQQCLARIRAACHGCGFAWLADLNASKAAQWLHAARQVPSVIEGPVGKAKGFDAIATAFGVSRHSVGAWKRRGGARRSSSGATMTWPPSMPGVSLRVWQVSRLEFPRRITTSPRSGHSAAGSFPRSVGR